MPVTTPMAKLIRKILPKNRVRCSHFGLPVRYHAVWKIATVSRHADRERDEQEVVERREAELPTGEQQRVEQLVHGCPFHDRGDVQDRSSTERRTFHDARVTLEVWRVSGNWSGP